MQQPNYVHTIQIHNTNAANQVLPFIFKKFSPKSIIDIGCGTGTWLAVAKKLGAMVKGVDGNYIDNNLLEIQANEIVLHNLTIPYETEIKFDLAVCLEVAEHLPESAAETIVSSLTNASDLILFSAAIPNQSGQNHINEQWPSYWQAKFLTRGYFAFDILREKFWQHENIEWWYKQNIILYAKKDYVKFPIEPTNNLLSLVHPELYQLRINEIRQLQHQIKSLEFTIESRLTKPKFLPALKNLFKVFLKK